MNRGTGLFGLAVATGLCLWLAFGVIDDTGSGEPSAGGKRSGVPSATVKSVTPKPPATPTDPASRKVSGRQRSLLAHRLNTAGFRLKDGQVRQELSREGRLVRFVLQAELIEVPGCGRKTVLVGLLFRGDEPIRLVILAVPTSRDGPIITEPLKAGQVAELGLCAT